MSISLTKSEVSRGLDTLDNLENIYFQQAGKAGTHWAFVLS